MDIKTLNEIESEVKRFMRRLSAAKKRLEFDKDLGNYCSGTKETGAVRRAALDLKLELNKISK